MVKMAKRPFEELIEFLERELDDQLRVVLRFGSAGIERLFARSDISLHADEELAERFIRGFPGVDKPGDLFPGGAAGSECLVGFSDETIELLLYRHPNEAVAIAFDRRSEDPLARFVEQCLVALR